jgi:hypothetical protein
VFLCVALLVTRYKIKHYKKLLLRGMAPISAGLRTDFYAVQGGMYMHYFAERKCFYQNLRR